MNQPAIHFLCDANASVGFGHLSRCLKLASLLRGSRDVRFGGRFSAEARTRIAQQAFSIERSTARTPGALAVVDIMFDKDDMDYYDLVRLRKIRTRFKRVVLLSSAVTVPDDLPVDVVIGHVLDRTRRKGRSFRMLAGLDYAPVSAEIRAARKTRATERAKIKRVFAGFGASRDIRGLTSVLDALSLCHFSGDVDLLLSPYHQRFAPALARRISSYRLNIHSNVRTIAPLLRSADIAFGTYGNITFESLCLGTPFLAIAVKEFQLVYAKRLEARGLIRCLGMDRALSAEGVAQALEPMTRERRQTLSRRGRASVDGLGIDRIRFVVEHEALAAGHA